MKNNGMLTIQEGQRRPEKRINSEGKLVKDNGLQYSYNNISFSKYRHGNNNNTIGSQSVGRNLAINQSKTNRENGQGRNPSSSKLSGIIDSQTDQKKNQHTFIDPYSKPQIPLHSLPRVKQRLFFDDPSSSQVANQGNYNNRQSPRVKNNEIVSKKKSEFASKSLYQNDGEQHTLAPSFSQPTLKVPLNGTSNFGQSNNYPNKQQKLANMLSKDTNYDKNINSNNNIINQAIATSKKNQQEKSQLYDSKYRQKKNLFINGTNTISNNLKLSTEQMSSITAKLDKPSSNKNSNGFSSKNRIPNPIIKHGQKSSLGGVVYFDKKAEENNSINNSPKRKDPNNKTLVYIGTRTKGGHSGATPKTNQDTFVIELDYMGLNDSIYAAVFDGHGTQGHKVSGYLRVHTQKNLAYFLKKKGQSTISESDSQMDSNTSSLIRSAFIEAFHYTNDELNKNKNIFTDLSGSTGVTILLFNNILYCANAGDSKCVIVTNKDETNNSWKLVEMSREHHPTIAEERNRIEKSGGRVEPFKMPNGNPVGPQRIWKKFEDAPGLMMSRTFGDRMGHACGIICTPEIYEYKMGTDVKAMVLGSDGVFEVLPNSLIQSIIMKHYAKKNADEAAEEQLQKSVMKWRNKTNYQDDITVVVLYINENIYQGMRSEKVNV